MTLIIIFVLRVGNLLTFVSTYYHNCQPGFIEFIDDTSLNITQ